jgi:hypothetical protein
MTSRPVVKFFRCVLDIHDVSRNLAKRLAVTLDRFRVTVRLSFHLGKKLAYRGILLFLRNELRPVPRNGPFPAFIFAPSSDSRRSSVYSSGSNKTNFVFRNEYFGPLKGGFRGENCNLPRVRKNDRFSEPGRRLKSCQNDEDFILVSSPLHPSPVF